LPAVIFVLALSVPRREFAVTSPAKDAPVSLGTRLIFALRRTAPFVGVTLIYFLLRLHALGGKLGARTQHLPWSMVVLSWPATLWFYAKVLLWPVRARAFADPTLAERFSVGGVLLPGLGVVCIAAILGGGLFWAWKKARHVVPNDEELGIQYALLTGTLLLVLPILLTLNLNALNPGDFLHGRYTYLPLAGLTLLLATGWHLSGRMQIPLLGVAGLIAIAFAGLTVSQEGMWKDDLTVFTVAHQLAPNNGPVARNLANAHVQGALHLADDGRCSEAMPTFEEVAQEYPQEWYAWAGIGECAVQLNDLPRAERALYRAAELSHDPRVLQQWQELREHMGLQNSAPSQ
jgi:hypothetical protein